MRLHQFILLAAACLTLLPNGRLRAEESDAGESPAVAAAVSDAAEEPLFKVPESPVAFFDGEAAAADLSVNPYLEYEDVPESKRLATRFGWWGTHTTGSTSKTGEYQGLGKSSPFIDVDGLFSNGVRTLDFFGTFVEQDATQAGLHFYGGPGLSANLNYDRFRHGLDHDPLRGFHDPALPTSPASNGYTMFGQDLNVGQDYALQVQQLKANFKGDLTENVKWRLNVWGMEKSGMRQANAITHCYNVTPPGGSRCHLVSRGQQIDWLTMEIEPVIEARLTDWLTLEYSRTMRQFQQNDQLMLNDYTGSAGFGSVSPTNAAYGLVPENRTSIDRLKLGAQVGCFTDAYLLGYVGNTHNTFRDTDRQFNGVDGRITNRAIDGLQLTGYGKYATQRTTAPTVPLNTLYPTEALLYREATLNDVSDPIDRNISTLGTSSRWRPWHDECGTLRSGFALLNGYEHREIQRHLNSGEPMVLGLDGLGVDYLQPNTVSDRFMVGMQQDWSCSLNTQLKYTFINTAYPMYGATPGNTNSIDSALNTNLPTHEDRVELTSTWTPTDNFMLSSSVWFERTYNRSDYASFDEDSYPFALTAWYSPTSRWSVNGGFAQLSNWINQDITLGAVGPTTNGRDGRPETSPSMTNNWLYRGLADVANLGTSYAVNDCLTVTGGAEYVWGENMFVNNPQNYTVQSYTGTGNNTNTTNVNMSDLPGYSRVAVRTWRVSAGIDYLVRRNTSTFFRYNYFDYGDLAAVYNTGAAHMFLGGLTGTW